MVPCSFFGKEAYYITKVFKKFNLCIAYKTECSVKKLFNPKTLLSDEKTLQGIGIYYLNCIDCAKKYTGQTGKYLKYDTKNTYIH